MLQEKFQVFPEHPKVIWGFKNNVIARLLNKIIV
jgi:hypothetical protein